MSYRLRRYADAARLMDEQIERYNGGIEVPSALYWRGRLYEDEERNFAQAANYYRALAAAYANYYYATLARQRLSVLDAKVHPPNQPRSLANVKPPAVPELTGQLPENDIHLIKARLLANAALNEYIGPEIAASPTSSQWGALAQAQIYVSFGEFTRSLQSIKHSGIPFFTLPFDQVPVEYWRLLFPQPSYWPELVADSERNGLDPYLVASLIRQESEFNAGVISHANAYGLMQLLPSVGKAASKKLGLKGFTPNQLLNPITNLQLGTLNLKLVLDRFGGQKSTLSPPTTPATPPSASGSPPATTRTFPSLSSLSPTRRRASTCRPSSATGSSTMPSIRHIEAEPSTVLKGRDFSPASKRQGCDISPRRSAKGATHISPRPKA